MGRITYLKRKRKTFKRTFGNLEDFCQKILKMSNTFNRAEKTNYAEKYRIWIRCKFINLFVHQSWLNLIHIYN